MLDDFVKVDITHCFRNPQWGIDHLERFIYRYMTLYKIKIKDNQASDILSIAIHRYLVKYRLTP